MSTKNKVQFVRTSDFETVEDDLAAAMEQLDDANLRIDTLLSSKEIDVIEAQAKETTGEEAPAADNAPASMEEAASNE